MLPARGRGHPHHQGWRRPDPQARGVWRPRRAALFGDHRYGGYRNADGAAAQRAAVGLVPARRKWDTQDAQLARKLSRAV